MNRFDYKPRLIDKKLDLYLSTFGAVCVEGPKVGFYDTVGGGFYGNSAESGSLIAGPTCFNGGFMIRLQ